MKKFIATIVICGLAYGSYYYLKHKNRFIYEIPPGSSQEYPRDGEKNFDSLFIEYEKQSKDIDVLIVSSKKTTEENSHLKRRVSELTEENERLRREQDEQKIVKSFTKKTQNNETAPKKELPIARNADTRNLDEFFKQRYGTR